MEADPNTNSDQIHLTNEHIPGELLGLDHQHVVGNRGLVGHRLEPLDEGVFDHGVLADPRARFNTKYWLWL